MPMQLAHGQHRSSAGAQRRRGRAGAGYHRRRSEHHRAVPRAGPHSYSAVDVVESPAESSVEMPALRCRTTIRIPSLIPEPGWPQPRPPPLAYPMVKNSSHVRHRHPLDRISNSAIPASRFFAHRGARPVMVREETFPHLKLNESTIGTLGHVEALANPDPAVSGRSRPRIHHRQRR